MNQISIWEKETFFQQQEVVIIGSGFVGLWSALSLKKKYPKHKITILDRGIIPTGASTRNAGFACFGSLSELIRDAQKMGTEEMLQLVQMRYRGLAKIQKYFKSSETDFELCGGYELYEGKTNKEELEENIAYLNSLLKPITKSKKTFRLADEDITDFGFGNTSHLVKNKQEGYLHPGKLLKALHKKVQSSGVQILNGVDVQSIDKPGMHVEIKTPSFTVEAAKVLLCTNAFTKTLVPHIDIVPARGQVLVTSPITDLPWKGTFHSDEGYYYFRNLGNRVLLGGARNKAIRDEETTEMKTTEFIQNELKNYLSDVVLPAYKGKYTIEHQWSGIMAMGSEKLPIVKEVSDNIYCAVRMSGMGVALAPIVAEDVVNMMY